MKLHRDVEKMITAVMRHREISRSAAISYMLTVATGRLQALKRYDASVPKGKETKGIFRLLARKKIAPKTATIKAPPPSKRTKQPTGKKRKPQPTEAETAAA